MKPFKLSEEVGTGYDALAERLAKADNVVHTGEFGHAEVWEMRLGNTRLRILTEPEVHDGLTWWHISVSARERFYGKPPLERLPSYDELCAVKRVFVGEDAMAIQVFPKASEHVNIHPHCLHLWSPLGHSPLPDFRWHAGEGLYGV